MRKITNISMEMKVQVCELFIGEGVPIVEIAKRLNIHATVVGNIITKYFNKSCKLHSIKRSNRIRHEKQIKEYTSKNLTITIKSSCQN